MKLYAITFLFLICFINLTFAGPKLEIEGGNTYDWGIVKPDQSPLKAKIKLWNKGDEQLEIKNVKPGCGCTTAPLDKNLLQPGEYATLDVSLNITSYNGDVTKSISIYTNEENNDHVVLFIKANVSRPVNVFPTYLAFSRLMVGEESSAKVVLTNNTDKPIKVNKITISDERIKLSLKNGDILQPKQPLSVDAFYKPDAPGRLDFNVVIETDSKEADKIEIRGWGNIIQKETK